mmetsp:Transcript_2350/g.4788  ORF Transcript_2350/g.4788 Transcript_2350/m.4788 type:complete len:210 (+) Transcript_2350:72-701(+)
MGLETKGPWLSLTSVFNVHYHVTRTAFVNHHHSRSVDFLSFTGSVQRGDGFDQALLLIAQLLPVGCTARLRGVLECSRTPHWFHRKGARGRGFLNLRQNQNSNAPTGSTKRALVQHGFQSGAIGNHLPPNPIDLQTFATDNNLGTVRGRIRIGIFGAHHHPFNAFDNGPQTQRDAFQAGLHQIVGGGVPCQAKQDARGSTAVSHASFAA